MFALKENNVPLPKAFATSVEFILNADFKKLLEKDELDIDGIKRIVDEFAKWALQPDKTLLGFATSSKINTLMLELQIHPENLSLLKTIDTLLEILEDFPKDSDGSANVALIAIDRSMAAWGQMHNHFPAHRDQILSIIKHLDSLRQRVEKVFPEARKFIRPGFDE